MCYQAIMTINGRESSQISVVANKPQNVDHTEIYFNLNDRKSLSLLKAKFRQIEKSLELYFDQEGPEHECEGIPKPVTEVTSVRTIPVKLCMNWKMEKVFQIQFGEEMHDILWEKGEDGLQSFPYIEIAGIRINLDIQWVECQEILIGYSPNHRAYHQAKHDGYNDGVRVAREELLK